MNESIIRNATADDLAKVYQDFNKDQLLWSVERLIFMANRLEDDNESLQSEIRDYPEDCEYCDEKDYEIEDLESKIERIKEILEV